MGPAPNIICTCTLSCPSNIQRLYVRVYIRTYAPRAEGIHTYVRTYQASAHVTTNMYVILLYTYMYYHKGVVAVTYQYS